MKEIDHSARDHATWSASSTARNWECAGALALTKDLPEDTNEAADWGTVCHEISEICLRENREADEFIGQIRKGKKYEFEVDEEMAETAQDYVDYVRKASADGFLSIEQKFSLEKLKPPFDAGGTGDAIVYHPDEKRLEVIDLKTGRGIVVEVEGNPQLRTYALGAMLSTEGVVIDTVTVTIVQTRAAHKSGRIRSETFHVADLLEWTGDLIQAMQRSAKALSAASLTPMGSADPAWRSTYLNAGPHCEKTFCKAAGFCPAYEQKALDEAGVWFADLDQPRITNSPDTLSPERAAQLLDAADLISGWINAVRAYWHAQAESGVAIPDYVLVPKQGREKWNEGVEKKVHEAARKAGLDDAKYLNPAKLKTPKQVRKALGKKNEALVADLSHTPSGGTNLVRADKTTREAVQPAAHKHFDILD